MKTLGILISGRVQKVGFRACVRRIALNLGISGQVMNLNDGRVNIAASGEDVILEKFVSMLYGCPRVVIREMNIMETGYAEYAGFSIRRGSYQYGM